MGDQVAQALPDQVAQALLPEQVVRVLPEQVAETLSDQMVRVLTDQVVRVLPEQVAQMLPENRVVQAQCFHVDPVTGYRCISDITIAPFSSITMTALLIFHMWKEVRIKQGILENW